MLLPAAAPSLRAVAELGARFIRTNATVLTHGFSRVVLTLLKRAVAQSSPAGKSAVAISILLMWHCLRSRRVSMLKVAHSPAYTSLGLERQSFFLYHAQHTAHTSGPPPCVPYCTFLLFMYLTILVLRTGYTLQCCRHGRKARRNRPAVQVVCVPSFIPKGINAFDCLSFSLYSWRDQRI
eukprot:1145852-Pelagomonas_calceolata.AAC.4